MPITGRKNVLYLSTFVPRRCGLATFTADLMDAVDRTNLLAPGGVVAMSQAPGQFAYDARVVMEITQDCRHEYRQAARFVNEGPYDVLCLQHEFGIFGGEDGSYVLDIVRPLRKPLVTTLHTVLSRPDPAKREITRELAERSQVVVVMARRGAALLEEAYGIPREKVTYVPHGAPLPPTEPRGSIRRRLGLEGRFVITTMGLLNPGKGIEHMIRALPTIVERAPDALYLVLGQTHPGVVRHMGEAYREQLLALVEGLGLREHVRLVGSYLTRAQLVDYLVASDLFVTPYVGREQIVSGTLAYAVALGKAIVSTPYVYAEEMLADGTGFLVPFRDPEALARAVLKVYEEPGVRRSLEARAAEKGADLAWTRVGQQYARLFLETLTARRVLVRASRLPAATAVVTADGRHGGKPGPVGHRYRFGDRSLPGAGGGVFRGNA